MFNILSEIFLTGLAVGEENRKPSRNFRTRPTARTTTRTTAAPIAIEDNGELEETSDKCPEPDGFFADAEQCDKYYACK